MAIVNNTLNMRMQIPFQVGVVSFGCIPRSGIGESLYFFSLQNDIPLYGHSPFRLSILQLTDIWIVSILGLL